MPARIGLVKTTSFERMCEQTPWATVVIRTEIGFIVFETREAYEEWANFLNVKPQGLLPEV